MEARSDLFASATLASPGLALLASRHAVRRFQLQSFSQKIVVFPHQFVADRHQFAEHVVQGSVTRRNFLDRHLLDAVGNFEQGIVMMHWGFCIRPKGSPDQQIELWSIAHSRSAQGDRVVPLHQRVGTVDADQRSAKRRLKSSLHHPGDGVARCELDHPARAEPSPPPGWRESRFGPGPAARLRVVGAAFWSIAGASTAAASYYGPRIADHRVKSPIRKVTVCPRSCSWRSLSRTTVWPRWMSGAVGSGRA